ncbi:N utilization substance protein B [Acidipropionibacterium virtanenii]|uniref:Transcription antitermination protein NusB n=1 Tax=Acidipropionibacterium virtanenii TaxID=2057246 RepID=A0A344UU55_9ACTN|nr:N utilization substance protein B [Acidipropionibacterium virtanenii]
MSQQHRVNENTDDADPSRKIERIGEIEAERISGDIQVHADLSTRSKARKQALDILFEADLMGTDPIDVLALRPTVVDNPVRDFAADLVRGVSEHLADIDEALIARLAAGWTLDRMPRVDRVLARIGGYEILFSDVPGPSAIAEALELGGEFSTDNSASFLNGLLTGVSEGRRHAAAGNGQEDGDPGLPEAPADAGR